MLVTNIAAGDTRLGANRLPDGRWEFLLWAPNLNKVSVRLLGGEEFLKMEQLERGYHRAIAEKIVSGSQYLYRLPDGRDLPDPASRFQLEGVHGPSQLVDLDAFRWTDHDWNGRTLDDSIFYELHVGTYTAEGTFNAVMRHLPELVDLGINTIELMPIAQFPGSRNWGYDGVYPFAPQNSYGGPEALCRLVNEAHRHGLSVALDVVYNHLGPEGNYLNAYGPYFSDRYRTPWGAAINFDDADSDEVRRFFIENALYWLENYHFDVLRLDAIHGIFDFGARHFLAELKSAAADLSKRLGRPLHLIAESDLNDSRVLQPAERGGYGLDAQWSDDFHHSVHRLLTKEHAGYYADFEGITPLVTTLREGWYYAGQYSPYRRRHHGSSARGISSDHFVVCGQNHDQVGNRAAGERLAALTSFEGLKLAAGITLLSPFVPLLFMGEEYGETAPFQYFTSHGDPALIEAVRRGRHEEFAAFGWEQVPDPQEEETFLTSHLNHSLKREGRHCTLFRLYQRLIEIRKKYQLGVSMPGIVRELGDNALFMLREYDDIALTMVFNFAEVPLILDVNKLDVDRLDVPELAGDWTTLIHSADACWAGPVPNLATQITVSAEIRPQLPAQSFLVIERARRWVEAA